MLEIRGYVKFEHRSARGRLKSCGGGPNLVVKTGKVLATSVLRTNSGGLPTVTGFVLALGMGSSGDAAVDTQVALQGTELFLPRFNVIPSQLDNELQFLFNISNTGAAVVVREWGLFNATTAGIMVARYIPNEFTFANGDFLNTTWSLEIG